MIWNIICIKENNIKAYWQLKEQTLKEQKISSDDIKELKEEWEDILCSNINDEIYKIFTTNSKKLEKVQSEKKFFEFLTQNFSKLKISANEEKNLTIWNAMMSNPVVENLINNEIYKNFNKEYLKDKFLDFCNNEVKKHNDFKLTLEQQVNAINDFLLADAVNKFIQENNENITKLLLDIVEESEIESLISSFKSKMLIANLKIAEIVGADAIDVHFNTIEAIFSNLKSNFNIFLDEIRTEYETKNKVILSKNFQINDINDKSFIKNKIIEILFSIGKSELDNTTSKITDYYVHNVLARNNQSKYVNLVINGLKLCSKYSVFKTSQINAIEKFNQFTNPSFDLKNKELTQKVLQYLNSKDGFKDIYSNYNKESSDNEYKKTLKEVNDFLEASGLNEEIRKNVVRKDNKLHSNIESISSPLIPSNNEIKTLVKNYLVKKEVEKVINEEIKTESLTTSYANIKKYWKELKKWITDYYLPPQIYLQFINENIYEPIAWITERVILNGNVSNNEIKTLIKDIEDLSLDIAKTIVNEFVSDNGETINKLKKSMNRDIHFTDNLTVHNTPHLDPKKLINRSTRLNFLYDHLLRNIYITTGHCLEKSKYLDLLNFSSKTIKPAKSCRFSFYDLSKPGLTTCTGDGEWRKTAFPYPIVKHLECLDLQRLNKSKPEHVTQHGCFLSRNITENDKIICNNTSKLLETNIKLKDKLSIIAKESTNKFKIKLPLSDSHIKEDTALFSSMSYSTSNLETDKVLRGRKRREEFHKKFQEDKKLGVFSKENFQTKKDSLNVNVNIEDKQEQLAKSETSNFVDSQQKLAEQTAEIAKNQNLKLRKEESLRQEQEKQKQLDEQARLKKVQEENEKKTKVKQKIKPSQPA